jgi:hypothetical protein
MFSGRVTPTSRQCHCKSRNSRRKRWCAGKTAGPVTSNRPLENLPKGPDRVRCYSDPPWRGDIWHRGYWPANSEELGERFRRDKFLHNRIGDGEASGSEAPSKGTNLDSGASRISVDNLVCERDAHCVEIYTLRNCADIAGLNSAYQYEQVVDRPGDIADPN